MRLIDADKIRTNIVWMKTANDMFKAEIDRQPTVEAEPVGHAYWKWVVTGKGKKIPDANVACSNCGELHGNFDWKYCPNCGSRMDLEVKADE